MSLSYTAKPFDELTVHELHDALRLRTDIFVVEQACAYHEIDGHDPKSVHVSGRDPAGNLIAYARIVPPDEHDHPHIGRVVVRADHRGKGHARQIMTFTLDELVRLYGTRRSGLAAQSHLESFYQQFGYRRNSRDYLWDGIPHMDMLLDK